MRHAITSSFFILVVACATATSPKTQGDEAYRQGNFKMAGDLYKANADQGDAEAAFKLAQMTIKGLIPNSAPGEGMQWFCRSCELGKAQACIESGKYYEMGTNGVEPIAKNYEKARDYYLKAAIKGEEFGQYRLAYLYAEKFFNDDVVGLKWAILAERTLKKNCHQYYPLRCAKFKDDIATVIQKLVSRMSADQITHAYRLADSEH